MFICPCVGVEGSDCEDKNESKDVEEGGTRNIEDADFAIIYYVTLC